MDLRSRLRAHMESEIKRTPFTDLGDVMERGDVIRGRRRLVAVAAPAAAVLLVVAALALSRQAPGQDVDVDAIAAGNARLTEGSLEWTTGPATLGFVQPQQTESDGVMYVLSTAPGARWEDFPMGNIPEAIYASTDGSSWESHPLGGTWVSSISAANGLLYAVGTAPGAEADSVTMQVGVSESRGSRFQTTALPFESDRPGHFSTQIMATPRGVLATGSHRVSTDPWALLPPEELEGGVEPVAADSGVAVFPFEQVESAYRVCGGVDPVACQELIEEEATYFASWEELGFDPEEVSGGEIVTHVAYWSEDGYSFSEVPFPFPDGWFERSATVGDSAVVSIGGPGGSQLFASDDARSWREVGPDRPLGGVTAMGEVGDEVVLVGATPDFRSIAAYRAPGLDGPWEEIDIEGMLPPTGNGELWINSAAVGSGGVAMSIVAAVEGDARSNPVTELFDRLVDLGGREVGDQQMIEEGAMSTVEAILVSSDLTEWSLVPGPTGGLVDSLMFAPNGTLLAHSSHLENGRPTRVQATATP